MQNQTEENDYDDDDDDDGDDDDNILMIVYTNRSFCFFQNYFVAVGLGSYLN